MGNGADPSVRSLVEEYGLLFERLGHSRAEGRLLGWLLMCDPPEQSMMEISEALGVSKGALSVALRRLGDHGLVRRSRRPGARHDVFRFDPDSIGGVLENVFSGVAMMERLLARSRDLHGQAGNERLAKMHALYARLTEEMPALLERWREDARAGAKPDPRQEN